MHLWRAIATLSVTAGLLAGCAMIAGVDQYKRGQCPGGCDASVDVTARDAAPDMGADTAVDAGSTDAPDDTQPPPDSGGNDGGSDGGCGATNTVQNCSQCGAVCDQTNASQTACNGTTCLYTCKMGFSNCANAAPDLNGCECATPSCCGAQCATTHTNGIGQSFYDCVAKKTYDLAQANEACTAYTSNQNLCLQYNCVVDGGGQDSLVCGTTANICSCWTYSGTIDDGGAIGHVHKSPNASCYCPGPNDPSWD